MKKIIGILTVYILIFGCSSDESANMEFLSITTFQLNKNCFSTIKLDEAEVIITNATDYQAFEDSIRVNWFESCDTTHLPAIGFDTAFFVGKYTQVAACSSYCESQVLYNPDADSYFFELIVVGQGDCESLKSDFQCAIVPKQSDQFRVDFAVTYYSEK